MAWQGQQGSIRGYVSEVHSGEEHIDGYRGGDCVRHAGECQGMWTLVDVIGRMYV